MESKSKVLILLIFIILNIVIFSQTLLEKAEVYYFNGKSSFQSGEYKAAERYFQEALSLTAEIEIKYPDIRYMLGWTKFYLKKYTEAEKYLKYYPNDEKVQLALKSIREGNIEEDLHFKSANITTEEATGTEEEKIKIPITAYIIASAIILLIILLLVGLSYFFVFRKYSLGAKGAKVEKEEEETIEEVEVEEEVIPVEEILEVKVDELEELWQEYEKMKQKMDIDEEEISNESVLPEAEPQNAPPPPPPPPAPQMQDNTEENLEELDVDNLLEESEPPQNVEENIEEENMTEENIEENIEEQVEEKNIDIEDLIEEKNQETGEEENTEAENETDTDEGDNTIDEVIEKDKVKNLDEIETVKPHMEVVAKYNKIMKEPGGAIVASNVKGIESLENLDEEVANKGGVYSKGDLHTIFKEIFAERNRDELMIE
ncbi:hypothetical protein XO10_09260 [Marinitoga sp. 1135]|uniref:hypothetical protein n=1 Tax=Marinitoga sp. 1135 TaxID=1643333 RepID=UPI0015865FD0|nr:hypothetical protein [Marinitoga sp. 1135]NUU96434.1 hypothetical protein [Marinitoga sp. 1135]